MIRRRASAARNLPAKVDTPPPPLSSAAALAEKCLRHAVIEDFSVYQPAGFVLRWYALALDLSVAVPVDLLVHMPFHRYLQRLQAFGEIQAFVALSALLTGITVLMMFVAPTVLWGQTLGKQIVGIRVVRSDFNPSLSLLQVVIRETVGKLLSGLLFGVGYFMAGFGQRKRALHDRLGRTHVIRYRLR